MDKKQLEHLANRVGQRTKIACPECGAIMVLRQNKREGTFFLGCNRFPDCKRTMNMTDELYFKVTLKITDREIALAKRSAILRAKYLTNCDYFVLDTETTGLLDAQVCQLAILHSSMKSFHTLVKPTVPIEPGATSIHHITDQMVEHAPRIDEVIKEIPATKIFVGYNTAFDIKMIKKSMATLGLEWVAPPPNMVYDVMLIYADFFGQYDEQYCNFKWQTLTSAVKQCGIADGDINYHDALTDCKQTQKILKYMAAQESE